MGKRTISLVLEVVIEIIDWFKTTRKDKENGRKNSDSKGNSKKK